MHDNLFNLFSPAIRNLVPSQIAPRSPLPSSFLLKQEGQLACYYTPFDIVNTKAKVVLVGITPGFTQWRNAVIEAQKQLAQGANSEQALKAAKASAAFSGPMRPNLIALLDRIGLHDWLGLPGTSSLFGSNSHLVQSTSIIRHATMVDNENYSGNPDMTRSPFLQDLMLKYFAAEASSLQDAVFIPLGPAVGKGLAWLAARGDIDPRRILSGLPHPSGANAERIAYFVGSKPKDALSTKTNAQMLDEARLRLVAQVKQLA